MNNLVNFAVVAFINLLAYWHKDRVLYVLAGFALITYAWGYLDTNWYVATVLILIAVYNFVKAALAGRGT